jgi:hypothetical protein
MTKDPKTGLILVPVCDEDGDVKSYEGYRSTLRHVDPFVTTLTFVRIDKGRSAVAAIFKAANGRHYSMFRKIFEDILAGKDARVARYVDAGSPIAFSSRWHFVKRGANYSITPYAPPPTP